MSNNSQYIDKDMAEEVKENWLFKIEDFESNEEELNLFPTPAPMQIGSSLLYSGPNQQDNAIPDNISNNTDV